VPGAFIAVCRLSDGAALKVKGESPSLRLPILGDAAEEVTILFVAKSSDPMKRVSYRTSDGVVSYMAFERPLASRRVGEVVAVQGAEDGWVAVRVAPSAERSR
jgi:hypothetical protein